MDATEITRRVDEYIELRTRRKALAAQVAEMEKNEKKLKASLIELSFALQAKTMGGNLGHVQRQRKPKPVPKNWDLVYAYIKQFDAFDLLQKRLTETAVKSRWEDGVDVPGIEAFPVDDLTVVGDKE